MLFFKNILSLVIVLAFSSSMILPLHPKAFSMCWSGLQPGDGDKISKHSINFSSFSYSEKCKQKTEIGLIVHFTGTTRNESIYSGTFEATLRHEGFPIITKQFRLNETATMPANFQAWKKYSMCLSQDIDSWSDVDFNIA